MATNKRWVLVALSLLGTGLLFGVASSSGRSVLFSEYVSYLSDLAELHPPFQAGTAIFILQKNVLTVLVSFILSPILCLVPVLALTVNGWFIGYVVSIALQKRSILFVLAGLLPHGILEIPAFILGEAAALSFGVMALTALMKKERRKDLLPNLKQNLCLLGVSLALLVPAAVIETYVTPLFFK
ncbi:MAG: stage II sporulation protein M [Chloroflexota bacterium]